MAFHPKKQEEFLNSLKTININQAPEKILINNFKANGLSDIYLLFSKLKNISLDTETYNILLQKISTNYSKKIVNLVKNPITDIEINQLYQILKDVFINQVNNNSLENIPKQNQEEKIQEQNNLTQIINENSPDILNNFIKDPVTPEEFELQNQLIKNTINNLSDTYYNQTNEHGQENSTYLASAIYLIYKKLYPHLFITEPSREKGLKSFNDNAHKELKLALLNTIPQNLEKGITLSDLENNILSTPNNSNNFIDKTNSDFSGITIVLNNIDDVMFFDSTDPENTEILKLKKQRNKNLKFLYNVKKYLIENDIDLPQEVYYQILIELLHRLQEATYPECINETREGNYSTRLEFAINNYKQLARSNAFAPRAISSEIDTLYTLTHCLSKRLDDKLQNEVLQVTFPHVLDDSLLKDDFKINGNFVKFTKKENGFCAIYFELVDALGRKTEVQLQSNMRYKETKNGLSNHNDMPTKKTDIKHFFELTDNRDDDELLNEYLSILNRTSKAQESYLMQKLENLKQQYSYPSTLPEEKRQLNNSIRRIQAKLDTIQMAKSNVKIKDELITEYDTIDTENLKNEENRELHTINNQTVEIYNTPTLKRVEKIPMDIYLPSYAQYLSPNSMKIISSAHATAPEAYVNKKDLIESFTEILRKGDEITYLSEFLLQRLKQILNSKNKNQISLDELRKYANDPNKGFYSNSSDERTI